MSLTLFVWYLSHCYGTRSCCYIRYSVFPCFRRLARTFSWMHSTFLRWHFKRLITNYLVFMYDSCFFVIVLIFRWQLFVANRNKPTDIVNIIVVNRSKLLRFFASFRIDKGTLFLSINQYIVRYHLCMGNSIYKYRALFVCRRWTIRGR